MVNTPRIKGTRAEAAVVAWLIDNGHPYAERRSLNGILDKGDVTGIPGICIEVKSTGRSGLYLAGWLKETERERVNANAAYGVLVMKPMGLGPARTGQWLAAMYKKDWTALQRDSGWPTPVFPEDRVVSGNKCNELVKSIISAPPETDYPYLIRTRGKKEDPDSWYVLGTLRYFNQLLRYAGYGTRLD